MNWDTVVPNWLGLIEADEVIQNLLGSPARLYMSGARERAADPSLEWTLLTPGAEGELYESPLIQLDFWANSMADLVAIEQALRRLLHHDLPITVGALKIWSRLVGGRPLEGADPDGQLSRSLDFRLEFLRGKYT